MGHRLPSAHPLALCLAACVALTIYGADEAEAQTSTTDGIHLPDQSVATQTDAASLETNPAGLGFLDTAEFQYGFQLSNQLQRDAMRDQHGIFTGVGGRFFGAGFSAQWLDRSIGGQSPQAYQKYTLGLASRPTEYMSFGASLNIFGSADNLFLDGKTSIDVGTQWHLGRHVGVGVALRSLNRPFLDGGNAETMRLVPGVAVRAFDGRLEVDAEAEWSIADEGLTLRPRVFFTPVPGLDVFARADIPVTGPPTTQLGDARVTTGLAFSFGHLGVESAAVVGGNASADTDFAGVSGTVSFSATPYESLVKRGGQWVKVTLDESIAERSASGLFVPRQRSLRSVLTGLEDVSRRSEAAGVVFMVESNRLGWAQTWEIRQAVDRLRDRGKQVAFFLKETSLKNAYLAASGDRTIVMPSAPYDPAGLTSDVITYGETLRRVGVRAEFVRIGDYKSSPERFVRDQPSKPNVTQREAYVDALFETAVEGIATGRDKESSAVRETIDSVPLLPDEAVDNNYVDAIAYPDEVSSMVRKELGASTITPMEQFLKRRTRAWSGGPEVAVLYIDGSIIQGESGRTPLIGTLLSGSETLSKTIDQLRRDPTVKAVVVRVDSPGGSAVASDLIYRDLRQLAAQKPVVASMGDVAASGGYYVAAGADEIYATPTTLTGSIGIFSGKFSLAGLFDRIGLAHEEIRRGERAGEFGIFKPWTDGQRERVSKSMHYLYRLFLEQAAQTRPLSADELDSLGRGRIWTGSRAVSNKLVDHQGGLMDAIRRAESIAGLTPGRARYRGYPKRRGFLARSDMGAAIETVAGWFGGPPTSSPGVKEEVASRLRQRLGPLVSVLELPLAYEEDAILMLPPQPLTVQTGQ
jgi:protease-4